MFRMKKLKERFLLPVAVVVLYVVAVVLYRIEDLVLYHPAGPSYPDQLLHILVVDAEIGHPAIVIGDPVPILYPVFEVVDHHGLPVVVEWNVIYPLVDMGAPLAVFRLHMDYFFQKSLFVHPLHERFVVVGLCHKHIAHAEGQDRLDGRLLAVEAVGDNDEWEPGMRLPDLFEEPLPRIGLAVLLFLAVRVLYLFRGKRDDLRFLGMDDGGLDNLMGL